MATKFTHSVRAFELNKTIGLIPLDCALLEIGAGDGWQAKQLLTKCKSVHAIDISNHKNNEIMHFPVTHYDGCNIPFENDFFDVVYSSNVLEHVTDFKKLNEEMHRVLRPEGLAIHCVPSATWRIWTSISHPLYVIKWLFNLVSTKFKSNGTYNIATDTITKTSWSKLLRLALFAPRHGEHGSVISETWLFNRRHWAKHFVMQNWQVINYKPSNIFYTGNEILGLGLTTKWRSIISSFIGSSSHIFILQKKGT